MALSKVAVCWLLVKLCYTKSALAGGKHLKSQIPYISDVRIDTESLNVTRYRSGTPFRSWSTAGLTFVDAIHSILSGKAKTCWSPLVVWRTQRTGQTIISTKRFLSFKVALIMLLYFLNYLGSFSHLNWKGMERHDWLDRGNFILQPQHQLSSAQTSAPTMSPVFDGSAGMQEFLAWFLCSGKKTRHSSQLFSSCTTLVTWSRVKMTHVALCVWYW